MLGSLPVTVLVSTLFGFLAGLGIGGGSLLMLWLTMILNMDHPEARFINLLFFIPAALIAAIFRWKEGSIHFKTILPAIVSGCGAAFLFSWVGQTMDTALLKKLFGGLLLLTGLRELFYRPRNAR